MDLKIIRVWILGASLSAFIFLAISIKYEFWAMKTLINTNTNHENTTYFGLWKKCFDYRPADINGTKQIMSYHCEDFGDNGNLLGIEGTPGFIKATRGFLISFTLLMGIATAVTVVVVFKLKRPLILFSGIFSLIGVILGIIIMAVFLGYMSQKTLYEDYTPAWAFYYFLIGWLFTLSAFFASLTDRRNEDSEKV